MTPREPASLQPRKVPRQTRAAQTVATILEAAARILETRGLDGLNTNLVAQSAGVSIGSLYQYFPGKDALIVALCQRERAAFLADAENALKETTGRAAIVRMIEAGVAQQLRRPALARLLDFEEVRPPIAEALAPFRVAIRALLRQLLAHDDLPPQPDMDTAVEEVIAITRGMVDAAGERGDHDIPALELRVRRAVFGYLGLVG